MIEIAVCDVMIISSSSFRIQISFLTHQKVTRDIGIMRLVGFDSETSESFACSWRYSQMLWTSLRVINGLAFPRHSVFVMQITRAVGTRKIEWEDRALPQFQLLRRWILMKRFGRYYLCCFRGEKRLILVIPVKVLFNHSNDLWL